MPLLLGIGEDQTSEWMISNSFETIEFDREMAVYFVFPIDNLDNKMENCPYYIE